jgi:hypothetical protein
MASIAYSMPPRSGRPGAITAIGVISIVVACLSFLGYMSVGFSLLWFSFMARFAGFAAAAPTFPTPAPVVAPVGTTQPAGVGGESAETPDGTADGSAAAPVPAEPAKPAEAAPAVELEVGPRGLNAEARANVAEALSTEQFISEPRLAQLDGLLARSGKDMFPITGGKPLTTERVSGMLEGITIGISGDPSVPGPDSFRTPSGRVELYDDRGVFYPVRAGEIVRVSRPTAATRAPLTDAEVKAVVDQAQATLGNTMNPAQVAALRTLLTTPGQQHVSALTLPTAIRSASQLGDSVFIQFPSSTVTIGPRGQTNVTMFGSGAAAGAAAAGLGFGSKRVPVNGVAMALAVVAALAGLGLAIYLFVIGIMVLRDSPRGRRLHQVYACLALTVIVIGTGAAWWLTSSFTDSFNSVSGSNPLTMGTMSTVVSAMVMMPHSVVAAMGCIYPIALLITMQSRGVKEYYRTSVS